MKSCNFAAQSDEWTQFETLCEAAKHQLTGVSKIVCELFYRDYAGGDPDWSSHFREQIQEEIDNGYVTVRWWRTIGRKYGAIPRFAKHVRMR